MFYLRPCEIHLITSGQNWEYVQICITLSSNGFHAEPGCALPTHLEQPEHLHTRTFRVAWNFPHLDEDTDKVVGKQRILSSKVIVVRLAPGTSRKSYLGSWQTWPSSWPYLHLPLYDTWLLFIGTHQHTDSWQNNPKITRSFSTIILGCTFLWGPWWDNF